MKRLFALILAFGLLAGCTPAAEEDGKTHILCTTYPLYLFTTALVRETGDVEVELLVDAQTSCLHNYTLTVEDMKAIDRADIIIMNGGALEGFMTDALVQSSARVIDCSQNIPLLPAPEHENHEAHGHDEEHDPHYWLDPIRAAQALSSIAQELGELAPIEVQSFQARMDALADRDLSGLPGLITFHDGFQYFAKAYGLELLAAIEEEEGAEASALELEEIIRLVETDHIPAIFVEKNGSRRSADVIARETGCKVYELDMLMSGEGSGIQPYIQTMERNLDTVWEALG